MKKSGALAALVYKTTVTIYDSSALAWRTEPSRTSLLQKDLQVKIALVVECDCSMTLTQPTTFHSNDGTGV